SRPARWRSGPILLVSRPLIRAFVSRPRSFLSSAILKQVKWPSTELKFFIRPLSLRPLENPFRFLWVQALSVIYLVPGLKRKWRIVQRFGPLPRDRPRPCLRSPHQVCTTPTALWGNFSPCLAVTGFPLIV